MKKILLSVLTVVIVSTGIISCSEDPVTTTPPKVYCGDQSTFTYTVTLKDANGNIKPGTDTTYEAKVIGSHFSYQGKDTVIMVVERNTQDASAQPDTMHMAYEASGDVSLYRGQGLALPGGVALPIPVWWTLPMKSKTTIPILSLDTNIVLNFGIATVTINRITINAESAASQTVTVGSTQLNCDVSNVVVTVNFLLFGAPNVITLKTSYFFSDKIGFFAKYDVVNTFPPLIITALGIDPGNYVEVLTSYNLK